MFLVSKKFISIFSSAAIPFVSGLETVKTHPVSYLAESNTTVLAIDKNSIGVFTIKDDIFKLKEVLQVSGVPYYISKNLTDLNDSSILLIDLDIDTPKTFTKSERNFLYDYVHRGGILIGNEILTARNGVLKELFGYMSFKSSKTHHKLILNSSPYYRYFDTPNEKSYTLSSIEKAPYTNSIHLGSAKPIARYENNDTAISINKYGDGYAINIGISLYDLRYRNLIGKDYRANEKYINDLEPLSDFVPLFIRGVYEEYFKQNLVLHTSKDGNQATVIMTHDVDFEHSIKNMSLFTKLEEDLGFRATYNIQVKYMTDDKDKAFFLPRNFHYMTEAEDRGHEIGSHTIVHTKNFFFLPSRDCEIDYPEYRPFSESDLIDSGDPTVCGETKVAKELLLGAGVKHVVSFRSGELLYNPNLPRTLEKYGYRYSSCFSAEDVLSYFPYRYMREYHKVKEPSKIWEIPLVLEDEFMPPMYFRVDSALELFKKIYDNGAVYTILDHPDMTWYRLKNLDLGFIESFYTQLPEDVWKATTGEVGRFWDARDRIVFRYTINQNILSLEIHSLTDVKGITFLLHGMKIKNRVIY